MKGINIGLIGFGNVGSGLVKILKDKQSILREKTGCKIILKKICDKDISSKRAVSIDKGMLTTNPKDILNDPQIDIVIELIGGIHPAKEYIMDALKKGKYVITANKALLAEEGQEIFSLAKVREKPIYFEASIGAGIPLIKSLKEGLVANKFLSVFGIVNGTSNYILSEMSNHDTTFDEALKDAKKKGFAEDKPSLDIEGIDSAHKLLLLVYLCFGRMVNLRDIFVEGISRISLNDVNYAKEMGLNIKLLAIAKKTEDELEVRVHPTLIPQDHLLSSIDGVNNAIYVSCDLVGNLLFYGPGAGRMSAASAVVSDLVDLTQDIKAGLFKPTLGIIQDNAIKRLRKISEIASRYYIRFMAIDKPGVLAKISGLLGKNNISISSVTQKGRKRQKFVPIVMITHAAKEKDLRNALDSINRLNVIKEKPVAIRIEEV
jgi:homoserine dehydrogenase